MMINFFYILMIILIISAYACLIAAKNTITSLLLFIAIYLIAAINFLLVGAEFVALTLIIVYVGAISILLLFVIMMLNLRLVEIYNTYSIYIPITYIIALLFVCEIIYFAQTATAQNICINYSNSHYND
jgi:NADH-quinone oxidoreductase subunit J